MKRQGYFIVIIVALVVLAGCGSSNPANSGQASGALAASSTVYTKTREVVSRLNADGGYSCKIVDSRKSLVPTSARSEVLAYAQLDQCGRANTVDLFLVRDPKGGQVVVDALSAGMCKSDSSRAEQFSWMVGENWVASTKTEPTIPSEASAAEVARILRGRLHAVRCSGT